MNVGDRDTTPALDPQDLRDVAELVETLQEQLIAGRTTEATLRAARRARGVERAWRAIFGRAPEPELLAHRAELAAAGGRAELDARHAFATRTCREALDRLRSATDLTELYDLAGDAIRAMGFDRSIVSRVHGGHWYIERVHWKAEPDWARCIEEAGQASPQRLSPRIHESELVLHQRPLIVHDVEQDPHVHRPVAETSGSRSYVATSVLSGDRVVGFLHGDCYRQERPVDEHDAELLWTFSTGFGYALERVAVLERLEGVTQGLTGLTEHARRPPLGDPREHPVAIPAAPGPDRSRGATPRSASCEALTPRESEVLARLAQGASNRDIARALTITEGTVKTHVKHVLRKLGATNRAEAVAIALAEDARSR